MLAYGWPIILAISITPFIVSGLGIREYGVYIFLSTVLSIVGLVDFGISTAVAKYLAEYHARGEQEKIKRLMSSAISIFIIVGLIGLVVFISGIALSDYVSRLSEFSIYKTGMLAAGLLFFVSSITSIYTVSLQAFQRFDISSKIGIVSLTIQQVSILLAVINGYSINTIFTIQLSIAISNWIFQYFLFQKIFPFTSYRVGWYKEEVVKCYKFGLVTFANNIATTSLTYLDRLIMPFFLGPSNLTYYSLPGNVTTRIPGIANSMTAVLFPMASGYSGTGDNERLKILYVRSFRLIAVMAMAVTVTTMSYADKILFYWISPELAEKATGVMIILAITNLILAFTGPLSNFLLGMGKLKFLTTFSIIMAILNTTLLVILLPIGGIIGAAWAYLLSVLPTMYMLYFTEKKYLNLSGRIHYYRDTILKNLLVGVLVGVVAYFFISPLMTSLAMVLFLGGTTILFYFFLYRMFGFFEKEDWDSFMVFAGRFIKAKIG